MFNLSFQSVQNCWSRCWVGENKWQYTALKKSMETAERWRSSWVRMLNSLACSTESPAGSSLQVYSLFSSVIYDRDHELWKSRFTPNSLSCFVTPYWTGASFTAYSAAVEITCACSCGRGTWGPKAWHVFHIRTRLQCDCRALSLLHTLRLLHYVMPLSLRHDFLVLHPWILLHDIYLTPPYIYNYLFPEIFLLLAFFYQLCKFL